MTSREKLAALASLNEQQLRRNLLIPLLTKMGYQEPIEHHHAGERGKDIVCKETDDRFHRILFVALVVKAGDITASVSASGSIFTVMNQVKQCFNEPYRDIYQLREVSIDKCIVVTSGKITPPVMDNALGSLKQEKLDKITQFIDGPLLLSLTDDHFPEYWGEQENEIESLLKSRNLLLENLSAVIQRLIEDPEKRARALRIMTEPQFKVEFNHFDNISRYVADVGYQRIEFEEANPYYTDLRLEHGGNAVPETLFELRKAARKVLYEMDDVIELLKQLATEKDPLKAYELTEELSAHIGGYGFQFKADEVQGDGNFYCEIKEYRDRKEFLKSKDLTTLFQRMSEDLKITAKNGLTRFFQTQAKDRRDLWLCVKIEFSLLDKRVVEIRPFVSEEPVELSGLDPKWSTPRVCYAESEAEKSITIKLAPNCIGFSKEQTLSPESKAEEALFYFQHKLVETFFPMIGFIDKA